MTHGSLFSGIGGFDLAAEWMGWENKFHCEWNEFGKRVLNYYWPKAESYGDITKTDFSIWRGRIDILTGGFPCQDASIAKQSGDGQQGLSGERTGLFYEMCRAIREIRPKYIIAENVANILKTNNGQDFSSILTELSSMGYNAEWRVCRASEVGAPHHRARVYLVAYSNGIRLHEGQSFFSNMEEKVTPVPWEFAGTSIQIIRGGQWKTEPPILFMDDGISSKLHGQSIKAYGNSIVPQIVFQIFKAINEHETKIR